MTSKIPGIIHQSWKDEHIPLDVYRQSWIDSWLTCNPDWERMFWTDEQNMALVRDSYPDFYDFYMSLSPGIKKADFCRFLYMHKYGGVYVDLDFICLKNLAPLLGEYELVLGSTSPDNDYYKIPNAFMASRPGLEFWLKAARDAQHAPPAEQTVEKHAGPFRLQWAFYKYKPENAIIYENDFIYPFDWIHFTGWNNGKYFKKDMMQLAQTIQDKSIAEIAAVFPKAYCLTFWKHNW